MYFEKKVLGLITARGGSKGLPEKNIKLFCGMPLIYWSISAALNSKYIDRLIISTDDPEIAEVAVQFGCEAPFMRPSEFATDTSPSSDAIRHAINFVTAQGEKYDVVTLLEPTSPLRQAADIDSSIEIFFSSNKKSVLSVTRAESFHPNFMFELDENQVMIPFENKKFRSVRRQDISGIYALDGTIYTFCPQSFLQTSEVFIPGSTIGLQLEKYKSIEIDDVYDFIQAEALKHHLIIEDNKNK